MSIHSAAAVSSFTAVQITDGLILKGWHALGESVQALLPIYAFAEDGVDLYDDEPGNRRYWKYVANALHDGLQAAKYRYSVEQVDALIDLRNRAGRRASTPEGVTLGPSRTCPLAVTPGLSDLEHNRNVGWIG